LPLYQGARRPPGLFQRLRREHAQAAEVVRAHSLAGIMTDDSMASWFETHGVAALLTMRV
jgi:hypothetical protein